MSQPLPSGSLLEIRPAKPSFDVQQQNLMDSIKPHIREAIVLSRMGKQEVEIVLIFQPGQTMKIKRSVHSELNTISLTTGEAVKNYKKPELLKMPESDVNLRITCALQQIEAWLRTSLCASFQASETHLKVFLLFGNAKLSGFRSEFNGKASKPKGLIVNSGL